MDLTRRNLKANKLIMHNDAENHLKDFYFISGWKKK